MLDLIVNAITGAFAASEAPGPAGRRRTVAEEVVWILAAMVFPALDFLLVYELGSGLVLPLPFAFALLTLVLGVRLRANPHLLVVAPLTCLLFSFAAGVFAALLGADGFFGV
jgi:hypothetical protein